MELVNPDFIRDVLTSETYPRPRQGETFYLRREKTNAEIKCDTYGNLRGTGVTFLTNQRIVFHCISSKSRSDFMGFQICLGDLQSIRFEQPILGANYLHGPLSLPGSTGSWRIAFASGGCGTFLPTLSNAIERYRPAAPQEAASFPAFPVYDAKIVAFIDPNDPSVVYTQQPSIETNHSLAE